MNRTRALTCLLALSTLSACGGGDNGPASSSESPSPAAVAVTVSPAPGSTGKCATPPTNPYVSGVAKVGPDDFNDTGNGVLQVTDDCLAYIDLKVGTGDPVKDQSKATVHYSGWLTDGTKFDSSRDRGQPFSFVVGTGSVIKGWDLGVGTMRAGGRRKLIIPYPLAYGESGRPPTIPAKATLVFIVEVLSVG